jgi:hypothetical protein
VPVSTFDRIAQGRACGIPAVPEELPSRLARRNGLRGNLEQLKGRLRDLPFAGMELKAPDGRVLRLGPETVRHLRAAR